MPTVIFMCWDCRSFAFVSIIDNIIDSQRCRAQHEHHPALPRLNQDQLGQNWCITMSKAVKVPSKCEALMVKREAVRV